MDLMRPGRVLQERMVAHGRAGGRIEKP